MAPQGLFVSLESISLRIDIFALKSKLSASEMKKERSNLMDFCPVHQIGS